MRVLRSPVAQFLAASLLVLLAISGGTGFLAAEAAEEEALSEARGTNEVLARSVARPDVNAALIGGDSTAAVDRFNREVENRLLVEPVQRINIWTRDGRVVYSNAFEMIGETFELSEDQRAVLNAGGTSSAVSDPDAPANRAGESTEGLVQIYTRFRARNGEVLLFEGYYSLDRIEDRREEIISSFRWITVGGPLLLVLLVTPMLWVLTGRLTSGAKDRERLLHTAIDASDAERRRIARDLHDSVVQDLAGTAFSVSAVARDPATPPHTRGRLGEAAVSLRDSLKSLRSLLSEIHPPELHSEGLVAVLEDLIAPAASVGIDASVSVEGTEHASDQVVALVWRVAQEAVRNALRHAEASTLAVTVRGDGRRLWLEVVDDGIGFDPDAPRDRGSFGLRGLRSLVDEANGTLVVRSSPGEGTTVQMEVDAR